ncbi:MAG: hypothetical protein WCE69_08795 [Aestuariivirga sp.]
MTGLNRGFSPANTGATSASIGQLRDVLGRLTATIEEENYILSERRELSLDPLIYKKSQLLLELMRAQRSCGPDFIKFGLEDEMHRFRSLLSANQELLSIHLSAAREVSNTILDVLRHNESDGTYAGCSPVGRGIQ